MNCHWKYGKIILFHLLKQALGVSELTGLRYQTHWARHCWSLTSINVMATDCHLAHVNQAKSWGCTLCVAHKPCWHPAHSFPNVPSRVCLLKMLRAANAAEQSATSAATRNHPPFSLRPELPKALCQLLLFEVSHKWWTRDAKPRSLMERGLTKQSPSRRIRSEGHH